MLIQKTFHLGMKADMARAKLLDLRGYRNELADVERAEADDRGAHFEFRLPCGYRGRVNLIRVPGENPAQTLFRSHDGNIEMLGVLEFFEIRPGLTEVVLTIDYTPASLFFRMIDHFSHALEHFLDRQMERVEAHFSRPVAGVRADRNLPAPINGKSLFAEEE